MSLQPPRKAVLLAAGLGSRMRPLSFVLPKCMLPLWHVPLIEHVLRMLERWGVREVLVNLHHNPGPALDHLRQRSGPARIALSFEPAAAGTGGVLRQAAWFLDDAPFWMVNTDIAAEVEPAPFLEAFHRLRPAAVLWGTAARGPRTVGVRDGAVETFTHPQPGTPGTMTFCGLQLLSSALLPLVPEGFSTIVGAYQGAIRAGQTVCMLDPQPAFWDDLGTPERYLAVHGETQRLYGEGRPGGRLYDPSTERTVRRLRRRGVALAGLAAVSPAAQIEAGARLTDSIVWPGAHLGGSVELVQAVAAAPVPGGRITGCAVRAADLPSDPALDWALGVLEWAPHATCCIPLPARGSDRRFVRLLQGAARAVLIQYGTARPENRRHVPHARFLAAQGIPVPAVLAHDPRRRCTLVSDVGGESLEDRVRTVGTEAARPLYRDLMRVVARLHNCPLAPLRGRLEPAFSRRLFDWEHDLFETWYLKGMLGLGSSRCAAIRRELRMVARRLEVLPPVLVHRDLQSSNVMLDGAALSLIDFQGMRRGPAVYDLASLLCDPYVMLPPHHQDELLACYRAGGAAGCTDVDFHTAAVQRLAQALGAYGRLSRQAGLTRFEACIGPALAMLSRVLARLPGLPALRREVTE